MGPKPLFKKTIPGQRPLRIYSFVNRDEEYFQVLRRLNNSVVINTVRYHKKVEEEHIVDWAITTGTVHPRDTSFPVDARGLVPAMDGTAQCSNQHPYFGNPCPCRFMVVIKVGNISKVIRKLLTFSIFLMNIYTY